MSRPALVPSTHLRVDRPRAGRQAVLLASQLVMIAYETGVASPGAA